MREQDLVSGNEAPHAVVIGAYGFIGAACVRALQKSGHKVTGVGRSRKAARASNPDLPWVISDVTKISLEEWKAMLADADVVVNASGALQSGLRDQLHEIHVGAVERIVEALQGTPTKLIHISAAGASPEAETDFMRTKAVGDAHIAASDLNWCILRPTLVLGAQAYGGTALLRAGAATPWIGFEIFPETEMQVISVQELSRSVVDVADGTVPDRSIYELTSDEIISLRTLMEEMRRWQGYPPWWWRVGLPSTLVRCVGWGADFLGIFGWRSPLRTTALKSLKNGVRGDAAAWLGAGGGASAPLREILASLPSTTQERWFARLFLLLPVSVGILAAFWIVSGVMGFLSSDDAKSILHARGMAPQYASVMVLSGSLIDIALGMAVLFRPCARVAALGMVAVSMCYLIGATVWAPDLWADPLGPLVKIFPSVLPAIFIAALLEDR